MDYKQIEAKWQKKWAETGLYKFDRSKVDKNIIVSKCFLIPRVQNFTPDTGIITDPPTPLHALRECKDTKCFSQWASTHSVCLLKTMP